MPRGPLPDPKARRRNPPTIPTTSLPVSGRKGRPPNPPASYVLGPAGRAWWRWAWSQPQALAWDSGALYVIARRAVLEDDLVALGGFESLDLDELAHSGAVEAAQRLRFLIGGLKALAGGKLAVEKEMRELDTRLGLTPEAMAKLRWKIVADPDAKKEEAPAKLPANVRRLPAVDPAAAAG